jgi:diguanylate cyclase (GGDEF)-like protein
VIAEWLRRPRWTLNLYVNVLAVAAALLFVECSIRIGSDSPAGRWPELLTLVGLLCFAEMKPIEVARVGGVDSIVTSTTFAFAILLSFGPVPAMLAQAISSILADIRERKPSIKTIFNLAQYWVSLGSAAIVLTVTDISNNSSLDTPFSTRWTIAVIAAALSYFVVNNVLVGVVRALAGRHNVVDTVRATFNSEWSSDFVLLALAPIVVIVTKQSLAALPVLLLPILAVYKSATISAEKEHLGLHDSLTDLPNRFNFSSVLTKRIDSAAGRSLAAVLLIDLDRFKEINDTLGHQAGDDLLCMIGPRIIDVLPVSGTVARLGGDEFAVLLPELVDEPQAVAIAHQIAEALDAPFRLEEFNIEVEASIGIAIYPSDGLTGDALLKRADVAMYLAKSRRSIVERYDPHLDQHSTQRLHLLSDLRTGIADGSVVLYYQPKLDLATGEIREVEALVRWVHPRLGVLAPSEFVPLAENTGLIRPLTSYVLDCAVAQAAKWHADNTPLTVAVNLSARSLHDGAILREVKAVLDEHRVSPSLLRLEITESSIMADPQRAKKILEQLNDMGVRLSIDDFGTGYSSLAYLRELPVSEIKIDRSFVTNVVEREGDQVIVRSTIDLARNLGLTSVAEGVETGSALRWLTQAGCNAAQGYHIARPASAAAFNDWFRSRRTEPATQGAQTDNVIPLLGAQHGARC